MTKKTPATTTKTKSAHDSGAGLKTKHRYRHAESRAGKTWASERYLFAKKRCRFITKSRACQSVKGFIETFFPEILPPGHKRKGTALACHRGAPNFPHPERLTLFQRVKRGRASRDGKPRLWKGTASAVPSPSP